MSLWWIPAGLAAWCVLAVAVALVLGPVLARSSQAREAASEEEGQGS